MRAELEDSFSELAAAHLLSLRRLAYAVTGDWHRADDLVQGALERLYVAWPRVHRMDNPAAYVRTILVRLAVSESRRPRWKRERTVDAVPDLPGADHAEVSAERLDLAEALAGLTVKQRAVVVLRYLEDRPVADVAEILGIAPGTVKRQCHDALTHLRRRLAGSAASVVDPDEGGAVRHG